MSEEIEVDDIATGLQRIRIGIQSLDWELVVIGYNLASGESLELPPKEPEKSKTQLVREKLQEKLATKTNKKPKAKNHKIEVASLKDVEEILKSKYKQSPIEAVKKGKKEKDEKDVNPAFRSQKGGKVFGQGEILVIQDAFDSEESKKNEKIAEKTIKIPRPKTENILSKMQNPEGDIFFNTKNRRPPQI